MMLALLLYAYAIGERSSRRIERRCHEDIACRVITANQAPDHAKLARFRARHERAISDVFGEVLGLCERGGLVSLGVIAVDGTKAHANASHHANRDFEQIAREILDEADAVAREEDERFGPPRGDELPDELATSQGRRGWLREAKRRLEAERAADAQPIPRSRPERLEQCRRRLEDDLEVERRADEAYEAYRARGVDKNGKKFGRPPKPYTPPAVPPGKVNTTDPDSRNVKTPRGYLQGYNAQAVCNEHQIVIAAELTNDSPDFGHLGPMIDAAQAELAAIGVTESPGVIVADAGYWHQQQMEQIVSRGIPVLIPPDAGKRKPTDTRPGWDGGLYAFMRHDLASQPGGALYAKRQGMIEPPPSSTAAAIASYAAATPPAGRNGA